MNLDNRQDLLEDALFYYSEKLKLKLCSRLEQKHLRAIEQKTSALESLKISLFQFYQTRYLNKIDKINALPENAQEDESMLKSELERDGQSPVRISREKRKTCLILKNSATERTFLLSLMKKYADGQDIAIRVGRKLQQTNHKINQRLKELNELDASKLNFADLRTPLKLQAIDCYTSYLRAEEEIALSSVEMKAYLAWAYRQERIIMDEISSLQDVEKSRSIFGKTNCLLLLKLQYEKLIENASQKFSPYTEIQHNKMPVMEHFMECMNISSFQSSVSDDELQDINQLLEVYDAKVDDVEIDANIVDDSDLDS
ncbi:hypothetical protein ACJMK2_017511 [Sinanodonta woodiana]|uniref:Uncharacterized protein n=1 Tax=Sinanodonta woodiana TaxID=1069815 RepID=A0ABD3UAQ0_SINWO